jgi:hypothetical protein
MKRTQIAERSAAQEAPLLLKFRVNQRYTQIIADTFDVRVRSQHETYQLNKKRIKEVGVSEAFAYERIDAVGTKQADTGTAMFFVGKNGNSLTFVNFISDLKESGYNLVDTYSYQKPGDRMSFICFSFNKEESAGFPPKVCSLLKTLAQKSWEHVHIWDNTNGTITINAAHIMDVVAPEIRMVRTNEHKEIEGRKVEKEGIYLTIGLND